MNASYDKNSALVVLPPVRGGRLEDKALRAWLAQSELSIDPEPRELLSQLTAELGLPYPDEGLAALRMWGQTGDRPTAWIAAADPVYLEPRLDHLCLHALQRTNMPSSDLRAMFDHLQATLADDRKYGFIRLGSYHEHKSVNVSFLVALEEGSDLAKAKIGRLHILDRMAETSRSPRPQSRPTWSTSGSPVPTCRPATTRRCTAIS